MTFDSLQLGKDNADIRLENRDDNYQAFKALLQQAHRSLVIFSHDFDGRLYDKEEMMQLIQRFALRSRNTNIRVLLKNCQSVAKNGHQFVELARRLSSKIQIFQLAKDFIDQHQAFIIVDGKGIIFRPYADRFEGTANFMDPVRVKTELSLFEQAWVMSEPSIEMRRLYL